MTAIPLDPLPFRLPVAGHDDIDGLEVVSLSVKVDGLAHWSDGVLTLEWAETQHIDEVSFARVRSDIVAQPPLAVDIPIDALASATLAGRWWRPRVELRARYIDAFANIPGARPGRVTLRIKRRDRGLAKQLVDALQSELTSQSLADPDGPRPFET